MFFVSTRAGGLTFHCIHRLFMLIGIVAANGIPLTDSYNSKGSLSWRQSPALLTLFPRDLAPILLTVRFAIPWYMIKHGAGNRQAGSVNGAPPINAVIGAGSTSTVLDYVADVPLSIRDKVRLTPQTKYEAKRQPLRRALVVFEPAQHHLFEMTQPGALVFRSGEKSKTKRKLWINGTPVTEQRAGVKQSPEHPSTAFRWEIWTRGGLPCSYASVKFSNRWVHARPGSRRRAGVSTVAVSHDRGQMQSESHQESGSGDDRRLPLHHRKRALINERREMRRTRAFTGGARFHCRAWSSLFVSTFEPCLT